MLLKREDTTRLTQTRIPDWRGKTQTLLFLCHDENSIKILKRVLSVPTVQANCVDLRKNNTNLKPPSNDWKFPALQFLYSQDLH